MGRNPKYVNKYKSNFLIDKVQFKMINIYHYLCLNLELIINIKTPPTSPKIMYTENINLYPSFVSNDHSEKIRKKKKTDKFSTKFFVPKGTILEVNSNPKAMQM